MARYLGVTQKVSSNSKHTLLCLYGHNILARINLIPLKHCGGSPSGWRRKASKERFVFFIPKAENEKILKNEFSVNVIPRDEQKCIPACHTFYMSYDAYALIGVSHHFSGNERLTVGKSLVMLGDLSLDVVERKIKL